MVGPVRGWCTFRVPPYLLRMDGEPVAMTDKDLAFFRAKNFGHVATLRRDGSPHSVAVWVDEQGGRARFNSSDGSVHLKQLQRDPRVAVSVHDQENPYLAVSLLGTAVLTTGDAAEAHVDELTRKYTDMPSFPAEWRAPGSKRVMVEIVPTSVLRYGYWRRRIRSSSVPSDGRRSAAALRCAGRLGNRRPGAGRCAGGEDGEQHKARDREDEACCQPAPECEESRFECGAG